MLTNEYPYTQREAELNRIFALQQQTTQQTQTKIEELRRFILDEKNLLGSLGLPQGKNARLLISAQQSLDLVRLVGNQPVNPRPIAPPIVFPGIIQPAAQPQAQAQAQALRTDRELSFI